MSDRNPELEQVIDQLIERRVADIHTSLPGVVEKYYPDENSCDVKPLVKRPLITDEGEDLAESLPIIKRVPICYPCGAGGRFSMTWDLEKGDIVTLVFQERSTEAWRVGDGAEVDPVEFRKHDLSDAVAVPGGNPYQKAKGREPDRVIFAFDGVSFHITPDKIELGEKDAGEQVSIDSKVQSELSAIRDTLDALVTSYNAHIHITTATIGTGPAVGVLSPIAVSAAPPASVQPTNSTLVTIKE